MTAKQVDKSHYEFAKYLHKRRWASIWHQLDEVLALDPHTVLEIGPGPGVFQAVAGRFGLKVETLDLDPGLKPDHVASADEMPFEDDAFDVVCAFQMLEHVPYEISLEIVAEMARVARKGLVISLPDASKCWSVTFFIPRVGTKSLLLREPRVRMPKHRYNGEHYWEVNKAGYSRSKILEDFQHASKGHLRCDYRVNDNPYHRFFVYTFGAGR